MIFPVNAGCGAWTSLYSQRVDRGERLREHHCYKREIKKEENVARKSLDLCDKKIGNTRDEANGWELVGISKANV